MIMIRALAIAIAATPAAADPAPVCQPIGPSVVTNDPQAVCHEKARAQIQIRTDDDRRKFEATCIRQLRVWSGAR